MNVSHELVLTEADVRHPARAYWLCQFAGWGLYSGTRLYAAVIFLHLPWATVGAELLLLDGTAFALTHVLRRYLRKHRWYALSVRQLALRMFAASVLLAIPLAGLTLQTSVSALQDPSVLLAAMPAGVAAHLAQPLLVTLHIAYWAIVFALWLIIYFVATGVRRRQLAPLRESELARALQLAELRLLKTQLNPHFLFNSLNTVRSLIADDPERAKRAVTNLANTLRYTLTAGRDELVSMTQELDIVRDYLALESMRFEDRLSVHYDIAAETANVRIPVMLLQTIVENSIKHGIAELPEGGTIKISARLDAGCFLLVVENPRPPSRPGTAQQGIGLRNSDQRLRLLFGAGACLDLNLTDAACATVRIRIPQPP